MFKGCLMDQHLFAAQALLFTQPPQAAGTRGSLEAPDRCQRLKQLPQAAHAATGLQMLQTKLLPQAQPSQVAATGSPSQAAATGATRRKQTAASRGGSTTNAAGSCSRPMVSAVGGASLLVKNDGTASEHVLTALVYHGRSAGTVMHGSINLGLSTIWTTRPSSSTWWHRVHACRGLNCGTMMSA